MLHLSERTHELELMDTRPLSITEMKETLRFLSLTNKYFGGLRVILRHLDKWSKQWNKNKTVTILDIGCGGGEIALGISKWAKEKGFTVSILAIDLIAEVVAIARENTRNENSITIERKDFFDLVQEERKFDYVIASLFLHHTPPDETSSILRSMDQLTKRGLIISDLLRSTPSFWAVKLCSHLLGNKIVRHDGPLSVRRSFKIAELDKIISEAGLAGNLRVRSEPWFRLSLSGEKV